MKEYQPADIRNFAVVGHASAGKTMLSEAMLACAGVIILALVCGPIRGIPVFWTLIDCSFGIVGAIPLVYCLYLTSRVG